MRSPNPLHITRALRHRAHVLSLVAVLTTLGACADQPTGPSQPTGRFAASAPQDATPPDAVLPQAMQPEAARFWERLASVRWNEVAEDLTESRAVNALRVYAYLSLAQFRAAEAASAVRPHPPISAAIAGASAAVLAHFFPDDLAVIDGALATQAATPEWPGAKHADFAAGVAIGRDIGARVIAWSAGDGVGLTDPGTPPVGDGFWSANGGPTARGNLGARRFFPATATIAPPAPPAFGSAAFLDALAEVRNISDTRTAEQLAIANFWNLNQSPGRNGPMNALVRELVVAHHRNDLDAARALFLANAAAFDALTSCFEAKYQYWYLRPAQADAGIVTAFPTPPHPSYPSAHSCISGAMTETLARLFPRERERVEAVALEASLSRVYAGIHYRFDASAGLGLGRAVAAAAVVTDLATVAVLP
jgi:membrane-associated phospholipid phosphatase